MLSFPPTPPRCASLLLPLLSCYKSSTFPLSMTLPIPPLSGSLPLLFPPALTFHILLPSPCVCQNEWQVSLPDAKLLLGGSFDDDLTSSMCVFFPSFFFFLCVLYYYWYGGMRMREKRKTDLVIEPWLCLMKLSANI